MELKIIGAGLGRWLRSLLWRWRFLDVSAGIGAATRRHAGTADVGAHIGPTRWGGLDEQAGADD